MGDSLDRFDEADGSLGHPRTPAEHDDFIVVTMRRQKAVL
jgi:hypothetical protein